MRMLRSIPMENLTIQPGWIHKEAAAEKLGVSIRQLENLAALGRIRKNRLPRQLNERSARVLYSIEDLDAIKEGKPNLEPKNTDSVPPATLARRDAVPWQDLIKQFAAIAQSLSTLALPASPTSEHIEELAERQMLQVAKLTERQTEITERQAEQFGALVGVLTSTLPAIARALPVAETRPWLTLPEAAEVSGLPAGWLLAQAKAGAGFALNVAAGARAHWRFNRAALREISRVAGV